MYAIIALMALFHWLMASLWLVFNRLDVVDDFTADNKLFLKCVYPTSKNIRYKKYSV